MPAVARRSVSAAVERGSQIARRHRPDYLLLIVSLLLLAIGVIVVYAISPALTVEKNVSGNYFVAHQLLAVALGLVIFTVMSRVPYRYWRHAYMPLLAVAGAATLLALLMPVNAQYPAHRWIRLGGFSFQSVELLKFALLMWLAAFLAQRVQEDSLKDSRATLRPLLIALAIVGFIVAGVQSDLGSTGVVVVMMAFMAFLAGIPIKRVLQIAAIVIIGTVLAISAMPYRRDRLLTFLHPEDKCLTTGYQACQALIAVGSGGMIGLGLGRSVQAYGYLPEAENDSIFAIYAEKFGFIGVTVLLGLFAVFFARLRRIIERAPDDFSRLIVAGVLAWLSTQALINVGAMIGLLPLKGITLPLVSYGGTSVLFVMAALGVVFQISRYTHYVTPRISTVKGGDEYESSRDRRRVGGAYNATPGSRT
ncbi:MAG TPA: putative peptidoglycan glycosyltransferase FtsW [Nevskiaceae bacterium]|nr:putative peptidoglycan glycosyltransferase FtsW [Nevskiaceae bacterium]